MFAIFKHYHTILIANTKVVSPSMSAFSQRATTWSGQRYYLAHSMIVCAVFIVSLYKI